MKIAIDVRALTNAHKDRGIGQYTSGLVGAFKKYGETHTYIEFDDINTIPSDTDIVQFTYVDLFQPTLQLPRFSTKTVATIHDVIPLKFPEHFPVGLRGRINQWRQTQTLHRINALVADSDCSRKDIAHLLNIKQSIITTVYLAPAEQFRVMKDRAMLNQLKSRYNLPQRYILYVGDVNWNKNVYGLLKAFYIVHKKDTKIKLVLVGKAFLDASLDEVHRINAFIHAKNLTSSVIKLGYVADTDLVGIYNEATAYVQPSFYEGFGLPVLEAMNCGVPVIAANAGSLPEIVGNAGLLINPYHATDLADAIMNLLNLKTSERFEMKRNGIAQAQQFSWQKVTHQMVTLYEQIIGKTG